MSNAIQQTSNNKLSTLLAMPGYKSRFNEVLGLRSAQFISSIIQVGNSLGDDCEPVSIISGAMIAATLDLPINKNLGYAWLVPFRERGVKRAQFQMGYRGYIQLALRSGKYHRMNAGPVNKECLGGYNHIGERIVDFTKFDPYAEAAAYFFGFEMVNGFTKLAVWSKEDVKAHAERYSQSYKRGDGPWKTHFDEMATKTVIANELRQWGLLSIEMQKAMESDGAVVEGLDTPKVEFPDQPIRVVEVQTSQNETVPVDSASDDGDLEPQRPAPAKEKAPEPQKPAALRAAALPPRPVEPEPQSEPEGVPVAPEPNGEAERPPSDLDPKSSQGMLEAAIIGGGFTFDDFASWADGVGVIPDCKSLPGFGALSGPQASRLLRAQKDILIGLNKAKQGTM
jgi:recombination protein RecT